MKKFIVSLLLTTTMGVFSSDGQEVQNSGYQFVLKNLLSHSVNEVSVEACDTTAIFLDAREWVEYDVSRLPGAIWVGYEDFDPERVAALDKSAKVVVYCSIGYRSEKIAERLDSAGFTDVSNLYGGIFEWKNQDRVVVTSNDQETEEVHGYSRIWAIWLKKGIVVFE